MIVMRLIFILFTLWCLPGLAQQIAVPELRQQVTDITGTLSTSEQQSLTQQLQDITHKTRAQVAVLVVPSTGDDSIEQYATRVFDNWRLGDAKRNDGILIIVAWSDRTVRIQVGYGLEEKVTDALAVEASDSLAAQTYGNVVAVREGDEESDKTKALMEVLTSDDIKEFIETKYDGAVVPLF